MSVRLGVLMSDQLLFTFHAGALALWTTHNRECLYRAKLLSKVTTSFL